MRMSWASTALQAVRTRSIEYSPMDEYPSLDVMLMIGTSPYPSSSNLARTRCRY